MTSDRESLRVPLDGYSMQLRRGELDSLASGLHDVGAPRRNDPIALAEALRDLPPSDRAPFWELAVRHYARHKPLEQAAGEIGMDTVRARKLLESFTEALRSLSGAA